jgi:hypothetical protein
LFPSAIVKQCDSTRRDELTVLSHAWDYFMITVSAAVLLAMIRYSSIISAIFRYYVAHSYIFYRRHFALIYIICNSCRRILIEKKSVKLRDKTRLTETRMDSHIPLIERKHLLTISRKQSVCSSRQTLLHYQMHHAPCDSLVNSDSTWLALTFSCVMSRKRFHINQRNWTLVVIGLCMYVCVRMCT